MPNLDGTGPKGKGPLTGRKRGKCEGAEPCPYGRGMGMGAGRGMARGRGQAVGPGMSPGIGRGRRFQAGEE